MTTAAEASARLTVVYAFLDFNDGGAQRLTLSTLRCLDRRLFAPRVLCVRSAGELVPAALELGIPVDVMGRLTRPLDLTAPRQIGRRLDELHASIVHVPLYSRVSPYVRLAARLAGTPLVVAHEHCRASTPSAARRFVDRLLVGSTRFVAVSEAQRTELVMARVPPDRVAVIGNGVDTALFKPASRSAARAELRVTQGATVVLVPARLVTRKGHVDLMAALPAIAKLIPSVQVLCAGHGPLRDVLPALAESAGLAAWIRFLGHRDDVPLLLAACDLVCLPSRVEGMPLALLEAMASGRAVVACDVGGVREALQDGLTGRLVPAADPRALAGAVVDLLADDESRQRMEQAARHRAIERYRAEDMVRRLESAYLTWLDELAGGVGSRRDGCLTGDESAPGHERDGADGDEEDALR